jgi:hypothetical protein
VPQGLTTLNIPETVAEAVRQQDRERSPSIMLTAFGADYFHGIARLLGVRKAIRHDWRTRCDKIIEAARKGNRKVTAERIEQYCLEGSFLLDSMVLPEGPGDAPRRVLRLRHEHLEPGDKWQVITVHRHRGVGVWCRFEVEDAQEYGRRGSKEVIRGAFPIIGGVTGNDQSRAANMLRRLGAFCHMKLEVNTFEEFRQYMMKPKGMWEASRAEFNAEREQAVRALRPQDIAVADGLVELAQNWAGFSTQTPENVEPELQAISTPVFVSQLHTESKADPIHIISSTEELAEAQRQQEEGRALEEAMERLREEARAKELVTAGATAERPPALSNKQARAAEITRAAVARAQQPPAPLVLPPRGADTVVLPPRDGAAPTPKLQPLPGVPVWMTLPKRR